MGDDYFSNFDNKEYTIHRTEGEARILFGNAQAEPDPKERPTIEFIVCHDNTVRFIVKNDKPTIPNRSFAKEASARIIYYGKPDEWLSERNAVIMGFLNKGYPNTKQQLFMMWLEPEDPYSLPNAPLRLVMFFFRADDCFSGGNSGIGGPTGSGQENGGAVAGGPNNR